MDKFLNVTDEQLQSLAKAGDRSASEELILRCSRMVRTLTRPYFLAGADQDDLMQEGMFGCLTAIQEYDASSNVPFQAYAQVCIRNRIVNAVKALTSKKHDPLNKGISLEEIDSNNAANCSESIGLSAEEIVISKERIENLFQLIYKELSPLEKRVLRYYLDGYKYSEIAELLHKESKSIDNAVQRIRQKLLHSSILGDTSES